MSGWTQLTTKLMMFQWNLSCSQTLQVDAIPISLNPRKIQLSSEEKTSNTRDSRDISKLDWPRFEEIIFTISYKFWPSIENCIQNPTPLGKFEVAFKPESLTQIPWDIYTVMICFSTQLPAYILHQNSENDKILLPDQGLSVCFSRHQEYKSHWNCTSTYSCVKMKRISLSFPSSKSFPKAFILAGASKQDVKTSIQTTVPGNLGPMAPPNSLLTIPMAAPTILNPKPGVFFSSFFSHWRQWLYVLVQ